MQKKEREENILFSRLPPFSFLRPFGYHIMAFHHHRSGGKFDLQLLFVRTADWISMAFPRDKRKILLLRPAYVPFTNNYTRRLFCRPTFSIYFHITTIWLLSTFSIYFNNNICTTQYISTFLLKYSYENNSDLKRNLILILPIFNNKKKIWS